MTTTQARTEDDQALEIVRAGFGDCVSEAAALEDRCLMFRVGFTSVEKACEAVESIGDYNGFRPERVCEALRRFDHLMDTNPHRHTYVIGREYSPVIYLFCWADEAEAAKKIIAEARPDELMHDGRELRAWWD